MSYVDGLLAAVPTANKAQYIEHAAQAAPLFRKHGATRIVECWGSDVPKGKVTDFYRAVKATDDEVVVWSWIEWPDKATRDAGMAKVMAEMEQVMGDSPMPFDGMRMMFGGFDVIMDTNES
ncbi:DUF1428 domain-containing protein [Enhygromyxa salina]|uniref:RNA signal recognition particle 4.5S RNA n=1 Tax=Enhygromyxa salina TaxID=215803 RepID=A0A2S9YNQ2_9BACT|nr:DUF1428 domain-containing protein [Enhygromyxa salina]PRQ06716.1 hypothetical protein ENSA7_35920 [Enhygromyxa salina]